MYRMLMLQVAKLWAILTYPGKTQAVPRKFGWGEEDTSEERKRQRKEDRRKAFYHQKEEDAQRIHEEQLKKGSYLLFIYRVSAGS